MEVIVDILLSLLAKSSHLLRTVVEHSFKIISSHLTEDSLQLILDVSLSKLVPFLTFIVGVSVWGKSSLIFLFVVTFVVLHLFFFLYSNLNYFIHFVSNHGHMFMMQLIFCLPWYWKRRDGSLLSHVIKDISLLSFWYSILIFSFF